MAMLSVHRLVLKIVVNRRALAATPRGLTVHRQGAHEFSDLRWFFYFNQGLLDSVKQSPLTAPIIAASEALNARHGPNGERGLEHRCHGLRHRGVACRRVQIV